MTLCVIIVVVLLFGSAASRRASSGPFFAVPGHRSEPSASSGADRDFKDALQLLTSRAASARAAARAEPNYKDVLQNPSPAQLSAYLQALTSEPRLFGNGSAGGATYIHDEFSKALAGVAGAQVTVVPFTALSNLPLERIVTYAPRAGDPPVQLQVDEPAIPEDPTSGLGSGLFNGYAGNSDDAIGMREVVYCNYCRLDDFKCVSFRVVVVSVCCS